MVGAARVGASSSMKIKGTLDTGNIDRGFSRVGKGFEGVKGQAKSFGSDMHRVASTVSGVAKKLIGLGIAGTTAMIGIASKAPAVAPALAKMSVSFDKLTRNLGEALAPAFEKVAGWLERFAIWVGTNKEKIGEIADKFLTWGETMGKKLYPWLEKIGTWAADHPGLFAGIVAGLALGPTVISGIASISSFVTLITGATAGAGLLSALSYIVAIGAASYVTYKAVSWMIEKLQSYTGMDKPLMEGGGDGSGQTLLSRAPKKAYSDLTKGDIPGLARMKFLPDYTPPWEDPFDVGGPGYNVAEIQERRAERRREQEIYGSQPLTMSAAGDRRAWFLQWWDQVWG